MSEYRDHYEERFTKDDPYDCARPENEFWAWLARAKLDLLNQLSQHWQVRRGLDVGCGDWGIFNQSPRLIGSQLAVAGDISYLAVQNARQRLQAPDALFMVFDAEHLPFRSGSFDFVHCSEVLEHLAHVETGLQEIRRVATENVVLSVPNEQHVGKLEPEHLQTYGQRNFADALRQSGFRIRRVLGVYLYSRRVPHTRLPFISFGRLAFSLLLRLGELLPGYSLQILAWCTPERYTR